MTLNHYSLLSDIQAMSEPGRNLFDHIMVFENYPLGENLEGSGEPEPGTHDFSISNVDFFEQSNYDLTIVVVPGSELQIKIVYNSNRYLKDTIKRTLKHLDKIIDQIITDGNIKICEIDLLTQSETQQLLTKWDFTQIDFPKDKTIIDLFREQVKRTPDNIAVEVWQRYDYLLGIGSTIRPLSTAFRRTKCWS